ncbi:MAG TPA: helix-turn-helix transcriptional regulator [Anaeromyxobacteraceae bacterium]|nr:helix-turn-helix transcriptional regulator [Anaeromyxobacteraceae bacterium]
MTTVPPEPEADPRSEAVRAFGRYLLRERELRGLALEDVARVTRLAASVIEAIEEGDPERMPPRGYLVGYLRSYAGAVGLDADDVVLRWQEAAGVDDADVAPGAAGPAARPGIAPARPGIASPRPRLPSAGGRRRLVAILVVVAVLLAAAVAIGFRRAGGAAELRGRKSSERAPYRAPAAP